MLQVWGYSPQGTSFSTNCNCIPVIYRQFAQGASLFHMKYAFFISGAFGRFENPNTGYTDWLDTINLDERTLRHIKQGKCIVVVDDTAEAFDESTIKTTLQNFAERNKLTADNFVFSTNNLNFPKQSFCDVYSAPFGLEYCRYSIIDKDTDYFEPIMKTRGDWQYPFISIGGEPRHHRRQLHNLIRNQYPSTGICTMNSGFRANDYSTISFTPEVSPYELNHTGPYVWHDINPKHFIHVPSAAVMETYIDYDNFSITEKAFKNLVYPQPFVMLAASGSIQLLRDIGFDVYDEYVDHSYDNIVDNDDRISAVFESFCKLIQMDHFPNEKNIVAHNREVSRNLTIANDFINYIESKLESTG
jgi:hypothetical protein